MKLVSYAIPEHPERAGVLVDGVIHDVHLAAARINQSLPTTMGEILRGEERLMDAVRAVEESIKSGAVQAKVADPRLLAPVPHPPSCRDAYAFRQHVATARRNRGVEMIPEFDQYPVFYFTNHNAIIGGGELVVEQDHLEKLDFELEAAIVIGKRGKNVRCDQADQYIAGYTIMNDFSARRLQMEEMKLNLGPAKGKDFATAIGPWLVTPDELADVRQSTSFGDKYDLRMTAKHNGELISDGTLGSIDWTFAEIIERVSYGVEILPGDVIGSGTVGTGCYLELNGSRMLAAKEKGDAYTPIWLQAGDTIELAIDRLGELKHTIVKVDSDYSILARKKNV